MEAAALYVRFKENLATIIGALNSKLEVRSMPYNVSIPLEVDLLADILRLHGLEFKSETTGAARLEDFTRWFEQNENTVMDTLQRVMEDKKAYMKTAGGVILQKEMLIRRLEYFNETAHTLQVMMRQQQLNSPKHFKYPFLLNQ
ncbi:hypothetical protein Q4E40_04995 [Pontibacter sp. BT731]|uniref:hypothetical protein n=1 Tax=Pontibacter coccineus TaxID=3063328 RepID=UPI0026E44BBE|nr:hypothetical protein [Pontibacter sp. BT731]MDO6389471.1 hypothetical protein [Pontibacter sp. BT731]